MKKTLTTILASVVAIVAMPKADAVLAAYIHVTKNESPDTRFHLSEIEAFSGGVLPDGLGGASFGGLATSTNDIAGAVRFGIGNTLPTFGTTNVLEHGGGNADPNNNLESGGAVWSTGNSLPTNAQYTLDLGGTYDVTTVRMWPRADGCCGNRWRNLEVQLLDSNLQPIVGSLYTHQTGGPNSNNAVEFTPVPEPSTSLALAGLAGAGLLFRRRR